MTGIASPKTEGRDGALGTEEHPDWSGRAAAAWLGELADGGVIPGGRALVPSAGMTEEALALARAGYRVQMVDPSGAALSRAKQAAREAKVDLETIQGDLFRLRTPMYGTVNLVADRTLFPTLEPIARPDWTFLLARILPRDGKLAALFRVALGGPGPAPPYLITEEEIRGLLGRNFLVEQLQSSGPSAPGAVQIWRGVFRRK